MDPISNTPVHWVPSQGRRRRCGYMVLRRRWFRLCGQSTRLVWSGSPQRLDVLFGECSRRGVRRRCPTRHLRGLGQCIEALRCLNRRRGRIGWIYVSVKLNFNISLRGLPSICSVNSYFVNLLWVVTEILNVSKYVAAAVLTDKVPEICS